MTKEKPKNITASVRQRLQNLARARKEDFQLVLSRYALERLLHRIDQSPHRGRFVVKGAMLFHLWTDQPYRPTRDIDFLAYGDHSVAYLETIFREVCDQAVQEDGLVFGADSVAGEVIKPDQEYQGVRIQLEAKLELQRGEKRHNGEVMIPPDRLDLEFLYTEYHAAPPLPKRLRRRGLRSSA